MISILMSVYNENIQWIRQAVNSIVTQTYSDWEFIIVVDNPDISQKVRSYLTQLPEQFPQIRLIFNKKNMGLALSMNRALNESKGQYIARMDADDISHPRRLEMQLIFLIENQCDMVFTNRINIDENGNIISKAQPLPQDVERVLKYRNYITHSSVLMKAESLRSCGGYRNFLRSQDFDLWLRFLSNHLKIAGLDEHLMYYRESVNNVSSKHKLEQFYTSEYQRQLFAERASNNGQDSFSEEHFLQYLASKHITPEKNERALKFFNHVKMWNSGSVWQRIRHTLAASCIMPGVFVLVAANHIRKKLNF